MDSDKALLLDILDDFMGYFKYIRIYCSYEFLSKEEIDRKEKQLKTLRDKWEDMY